MDVLEENTRAEREQEQSLPNLESPCVVHLVKVAMWSNHSPWGQRQGNSLCCVSSDTDTLLKYSFGENGKSNR